MYDSILVPTDGSEGSAEAVAEAAELAATTGATVHGLYVVDTRDYSALSEAQWLTVEDELRAAGESALEEVTERAAAAGVDADTALSRGVPHEEILGYAEETGVDLVVMGTHGRTGLGRFLIGSVTEKVIRSADVPVLVIRVAD